MARNRSRAPALPTGTYADFLTASVLLEAADNMLLLAALQYAEAHGLLDRDRGEPEEHELALDLAWIAEQRRLTGRRRSIDETQAEAQAAA